MNLAVTAFVPCRKGSERVANKNTRPFGPFKHGLLEIKLNQLLACPHVTGIVLSTNDDDIISFAQDLCRDHLVTHRRDDRLSAGTTATDSLVPLVHELIPDGHIMWTHVTSPFVTADQYGNILQAYFDALSSGFDSLMTTTPLHGFVWDANGPINYDRARETWPRTQTLPVLHEINSAAFISHAQIYAQYGDRIGIRPYMHPLPRLAGTDIDWEDDFHFAEKLLLNGLATI